MIVVAAELNFQGLARVRVHHHDFYLGRLTHGALDVLNPVAICNQLHPHIRLIIWGTITLNSINFNQELLNGFFGIDIDTDDSGPTSANFIALYACF